MEMQEMAMEMNEFILILNVLIYPIHTSLFFSRIWVSEHLASDPLKTGSF